MALRILLVLETSQGGSGRHVLDLAERLLALGHAVHIVYSPLRADAMFLGRLRSIAGWKAAAIAMRRAPHLSDLTAALALRRYLKAEGPFDIVHGHSSKAGALVRLAAVGAKAARVYTPHCFRTLDPALPALWRGVYGLAEWFLARFGEAVIAVSPDERRHALALGVPADRLHLVINGVDPPDASRRPALRAAHAIAPGEVVVGFLGRYVPQKAPQRMLEVLARHEGRGCPYRLVMVGEGPLEGSLKAGARRLGLEDRILWLPGVIGADAMLLFDVFAMPSVYEAMPYVLIEAAAAGLPIVATEVGGARVIIEPGRNGRIVANWDAEAFAMAIVEIAGRKDLREAMSMASREAARAYTIDAMTLATLEVYQSARAIRRKPRGEPA